jgi:hypothetical protein
MGSADRGARVHARTLKSAWTASIVRWPISPTRPLAVGQSRRSSTRSTGPKGNGARPWRNSLIWTRHRAAYQMRARFAEGCTAIWMIGTHWPAGMCLKRAGCWTPSVLGGRIVFKPVQGDDGAPMYELQIPIAFDRLLVSIVPTLETVARVGLASPRAHPGACGAPDIQIDLWLPRAS